jgi:chromate transporter
MDRPTAERSATSASKPSLADLFIAFTGIAVIGFGGVLPWARRMLVEQRRWLTADEFTEILSLGQFLPGGNVVNMSVVIGQRFHGALGSIAAASGLLLGPTLIVTGLGALYLEYGQLPVVQRSLAGMTAAAAGLILSMAVKMVRPLIRRDAVAPLIFAVLTFVGIGVLLLPLYVVFVVLVPLSIAVAWVKTPA